jgi:hypothetical protein
VIAGRGGSGWSRRFTDAGHLALDAVVAFVDDELPPGPAQRAADHVDRCLTCAAEVAAQRQARRRVRAAECPSVPGTLLRALRSIPDAEPLPEPPAGLSVAPDGSLVVPVGAPDQTSGEPVRRRRRRAFGVAVAVSSGVAAGAAALVAIAGTGAVAGVGGSGAPAGASVRPTTTAASADLSVRRDAATPASAAPSSTTPSSTTPSSGPAVHGPGAP